MWRKHIYMTVPIDAQIYFNRDVSSKTVASKMND